MKQGFLKFFIMLCNCTFVLSGVFYFRLIFYYNLSADYITILSFLPGQYNLILPHLQHVVALKNIICPEKHHLPQNNIIFTKKIFPGVPHLQHVVAPNNIMFTKERFPGAIFMLQLKWPGYAHFGAMLFTIKFQS